MIKVKGEKNMNWEVLSKLKKLYILLVVICFIFIGCGRKESRYLKDNFVFVEGGNLKIDERYKNYFKDGDTNVKLTYNFYMLESMKLPKAIGKK